MNKKEKSPCGELLQGQSGEENIIILNSTVPLRLLQQVFSGGFELEFPAPWDDCWILIPTKICPNGCDLRSFAFDLQDKGLNIKIPPEMPIGTPTFQQVFCI